jgi:hypothetical protein
VLDLIYDEQADETLASEALPCRPDDNDFELLTKAILRRYCGRTLHLWRGHRSAAPLKLCRLLAVDRNTRSFAAAHVL